jgi:hypothetical protein
MLPQDGPGDEFTGTPDIVSVSVAWAVSGGVEESVTTKVNE